MDLSISKSGGGVVVEMWRWGGYLLADGSSHGHRERPHIASAQVLTLALVAEELELPLLLVIQAVAVAHLRTDRQTERQTAVNMWCRCQRFLLNVS